MTNAKYLRKIRSFVRREGRLTPGQSRALQALWPTFGLNFADGMIDVSTVFHRKALTIVEIGFGNGEALLTQAKQHPDQNYIGIEVHRPGVGALLMRMQDQDINNIRIYQEDAVEVLQHCIPDNTLAKVNIFFPDPWPKKRHHKRRLIQPDFIQLTHKKLIPQGLLHLATDWQDYAEHMMQVMTEVKGFNNVAGKAQFASRDQRPMTKFEERGIKRGHAVFDLQFVKTC